LGEWRWWISSERTGGWPAPEGAAAVSAAQWSFDSSWNGACPPTPRDAPRRFHPQFPNKNSRDIGKSQSKNRPSKHCLARTGAGAGGAPSSSPWESIDISRWINEDPPARARRSRGRSPPRHPSRTSPASPPRARGRRTCPASSVSVPVSQHAGKSQSTQSSDHENCDAEMVLAADGCRGHLRPPDEGLRSHPPWCTHRHPVDGGLLH
jgi:hypothetical protein